MIDHARVEAQNHWFTFDEKIKVESVSQSVCDLALRFGESAAGEDALMVAMKNTEYSLDHLELLC